jgi:hypothetical protein
LFLPTKVGSISSSSIFWKTWKGLLLMYPHCCARDLENLITLQTFSSPLNSQQLVLGLWSFLCFYTAPLPGISCSPQCLPAVLQHQGCLPGIQTSQNIGHRSCSPFCPWEELRIGSLLPMAQLRVVGRGAKVGQMVDRFCPSWLCAGWVLQLPNWFLEFSQVFGHLGPSREQESRPSSHFLAGVF